MASDRPHDQPREREFVHPSRRRRPPLARAVILLSLVALVVWWLWALFVDEGGVTENRENFEVERGADGAGWGGARVAEAQRS
ncbi:MAG: hypothetical protein M3O70_00550 [Actinomycetota bacterium]|nr:hypothetical protein [Actinomycetota bacterium]